MSGPGNITLQIVRGRNPARERERERDLQKLVWCTRILRIFVHLVED